MSNIDKNTPVYDSCKIAMYPVPNINKEYFSDKNQAVSSIYLITWMVFQRVIHEY